ncbi:hypothetical protein FKP32DRAFT_1542375, partial [Trametes sanguinea]
MRIDGNTRCLTELDGDTGGILLRRLHPRIANYNDLVIFLMKCNMDIKFVGSGEAAKALIYYVTDYITKASLPAHVGIAAMSYAIQKTNEQLPAMAVDTRTSRPKGALNMAVNRMMAHQEISHQQVMSYLVGGGDVYSSHRYRVLHWGAFDRFFRVAFAEDRNGAHDHVDAPAEPEETCVLALQAGSITSSSQQQDYIHRSTEPVFDVMCLYEFVASTEKVRLKRDVARRSTHENVSVDEHRALMVDRATNERHVGSRPLPRGCFSSSEHSQRDTHVLCAKREHLVPVILGDRIPRSDRGEEEKDAWARTMLILFVPWRRPTDVRRVEESWTEAFERQEYRISPSLRVVISNMNVLSECRDVRDACSTMRRAEALAFLKEGAPSAEAGGHTGLGDENVSDDYQLFERPDTHDYYDDVESLEVTRAAMDAKIGAPAREVLDQCYGVDCAPGNHLAGGTKGDARIRTEDDENSISQQQLTMRALKKQRRPRPPTESTCGEGRPHKRRRGADIVESVSLSTLRPERLASSSRTRGDPDVAALIDDIVRDLHLDSNPEQERAFRIIAEQVKLDGGQLLMYIAGVGGTGKTHVVKAVLRLFEHLGR